MKKKAGSADGALPSRGKRYPLLYQQRFNEMVFWPTILIVGLCAALIVRGVPEFETYLSVTLLGSGAILILTLFFRLRAYVQCRSSGLRVQLPFYHLEIPYRSIQSTRPTDIYRVFLPTEQRWTQRRFLMPIFGRTVVVVELEELPAPRRRLRLWMTKYMLSPETEGLVLAVRDWIGLRTQLDEFKARSHHASSGHNRSSR
jgi:extradiol dioxygenase family protein